MSAATSERTRTFISRSLPLVQPHKEHLITRMESNLRLDEPDGTPIGHSELSAMILVELLLTQAHHLSSSSELGDLRDVADEHRAHGISGRDYSRFGDALVPVLKDLFGARVPPEVPAAWCDMFWVIVRAALAQRELA